MIVKLFETENDKPNFMSQTQAYKAIAIETVSDEELKSLSKSISEKYSIEPMWVKWSPVPIKSKLILASNPYLANYICLNPESFVYSGFDRGVISKHIEHHIQHFVNISKDNNYLHDDNAIELNDWFDGINKKYLYQCSCGFVAGAVNRKETATLKFLRKPVCCGSEYSFVENKNCKAS